MQWPLLMELCWLLPGTHLHIVMVSPSLPDDLPQQGQWVCCAAQASCWEFRASCTACMVLSMAGLETWLARNPVSEKVMSRWPVYM